MSMISRAKRYFAETWREARQRPAAAIGSVALTLLALGTGYEAVHFGKMWLDGPPQTTVSAPQAALGPTVDVLPTKVNEDGAGDLGGVLAVFAAVSIAGAALNWPGKPDTRKVHSESANESTVELGPRDPVARKVEAMDDVRVNVEFYELLARNSMS